MLVQFGDVQVFLEENKDIAPVNNNKLLSILQNPQDAMFLQVELAITVDVYKPFVEAMYKLEGDGPLALHAYTGCLSPGSSKKVRPSTLLASFFGLYTYTTFALS